MFVDHLTLEWGYFSARGQRRVPGYAGRQV
jgi:hypothetical protein